METRRPRVGAAQASIQRVEGGLVGRAWLVGAAVGPAARRRGRRGYRDASPPLSLGDAPAALP
jgi:hypothetical protein